MFAESLLESSGGVKTGQRWTTLLSLSLEAAVIGFLVLLPLLENQALPAVLWTVSTPVAPPPLGVFHPGTEGGGGSGRGSSLPALDPTNVIRLHADQTPGRQGPRTEAPGPNLPRGVPWGVPDSVGPVLPVPSADLLPPRAPISPPVSVLTEGDVVYRVLPVYPPLARQIGAQGPVVLHAVISREGTVESLRVISSPHPLLDEAALNAVRQWRFRPYLLNGVALEVEAQITVNFVMPR